MQILEERWVFTLATCSDCAGAIPHCAPLFYALARDPADGAPLLLFTSDPTSTHGEQLDVGPTEVGGAVYLESEVIGELRGVQMRAQVTRLEVGSEDEARAREAYLTRHPVARDALAAGKHRLYRMRVHWAKLTDNRLGFGKHPVVSFSR
jgi:uncharacterized protein YhbP (UPF0306 family)